MPYQGQACVKSQRRRRTETTGILEGGWTQASTTENQTAAPRPTHSSLSMQLQGRVQGEEGNGSKTVARSKGPSHHVHVALSCSHKGRQAGRAPWGRIPRVCASSGPANAMPAKVCR